MRHKVKLGCTYVVIYNLETYGKRIKMYTNLYKCVFFAGSSQFLIFYLFNIIILICSLQVAFFLYSQAIG